MVVRTEVLSSQSSAETQVTADRLKKLRLITAVKTPYLENGKFDLPAYDRILENQIAAGVEGVIVGGTTGEGQLMSWDEHIMLIAHTVNKFGHRVAVVGNTGSNSTREAIHATEQGFAVGMHAALQINPYYGKTSQAGLLTHFNAVLGEGPAIIYNVPGRTGQDIPDSIIQKIRCDVTILAPLLFNGLLLSFRLCLFPTDAATRSTHPNFLGVKECTGNKRIKAYTSQGINCWSGNDDEAHEARHDAGAVGVISGSWIFLFLTGVPLVLWSIFVPFLVTSNVVPGLMCKLMTARDDELNKSLAELYSWMFCEPNPISLNTAFAMCGVSRPVFRLPYVPLSREQREKGATLLRKVQQHIPGCTEVKVMDDADFKLIDR